MSEKLYQQQAPQGDQGCDPNCGGSCGQQAGPDGNVYDADYKVVDEDDKGENK